MHPPPPPLQILMNPKTIITCTEKALNLIWAKTFMGKASERNINSTKMCERAPGNIMYVHVSKGDLSEWTEAKHITVVYILTHLR